MTMALQPNREISLFDKYRLSIPQKLKWLKDGLPGKRVLFITDRKETFVVSFDEGMELMDMNPEPAGGVPMVSFRYSENGKYIHLRRADRTACPESGNYAFFHIELEDGDGNTLYLPGQMTANSGYEWAEGVEPVLIKLLEGIAVCGKERGCD